MARKLEFLETPAEARIWCDLQRSLGHQIGYVPTMGALHNGHLSLVRRSIAENDLTCVSIFVNPLQFNNPEDLNTYPVNLEQDLDVLDQAQVSMVYTGSLATFFPESANPAEMDITVPCKAIVGLEQEFRPGHLEGVQAIVERLFDTVGRCRAYFGEKDFQQTLVVKEIAQRTGDIDIIVCPTIREASGLAMSSRNQRLSDDALKAASALYRALTAAKDAWQNGERSAAVLTARMQSKLTSPSIDIEYVAVRNPSNWTADEPRVLQEDARALIAVSIDGVRLIDNMRLGEG